MTTEESGEVFVSTLGVPEGGGVGSEGGGGDDVRIEEDNSNSGAESGIGQPNSVVVSSPVAGHQQSGGRVLIVSPTTLYFPPPLNRIITNLVKLRNTNKDYYVAYKVKTTRPNRYCVRPNLGLIAPDTTIELQIHFSFQKDPPTSLRAADKFQVESILMTPPLSNDQPLAELFKTTPKEKIEKEKLKCRFASPTPTLPDRVIKEEEQQQVAKRLAQELLASSGGDNSRLKSSSDKGASDLKYIQAERDTYRHQVRELQGKLQSAESAVIALKQRNNANGGPLYLQPPVVGLSFGVLGVALGQAGLLWSALLLLILLAVGLAFGVPKLSAAAASKRK